jgi:hypothetical protein
MNPVNLKNGDIVADKYNNNHYKVVVNDKNGMAKMKNLTSKVIENWNSCNNDRFYRLKGQLELW